MSALGPEGGVIEIPRDDSVRGSQEPSRSKVKILTLEEILNVRAADWLIENILPRAALAMLTGQPASMKTFLALDWCLSIALGCSWQGMQCQSGHILYLAAEGGPGLRTRIMAWMCDRSEEERALLAERVRAIASPVQLLDEAQFQQLLDEIRSSSLRPLLIVIDTLARCAVGGDENNAGDMGVFVDRCGQIQRLTGSTVLVVHHNKKDDNGYRGSSALSGAVDTHVSITRTHDRLVIKCEKQKDAAAFDPLELAWEVVHVETLDTGRERTSCRIVVPAQKSQFQPRLTRAQTQFCEALWNQGGTAGVELAALKGVPEKSRYRTAKDLEQEGYVRLSDGDGRRFAIPTTQLQQVVVPRVPCSSNGCSGTASSEFQPPTAPRGRGAGTTAVNGTLPGIEPEGSVHV